MGLLSLVFERGTMQNYLSSNAYVVTLNGDRLNVLVNAIDSGVQRTSFLWSKVPFSTNAIFGTRLLDDVNKDGFINTVLDQTQCESLGGTWEGGYSYWLKSSLKNYYVCNLKNSKIFSDEYYIEYIDYGELLFNEDYTREQKALSFTCVKSDGYCTTIRTGLTFHKRVCTQDQEVCNGQILTKCLNNTLITKGYIDGKCGYVSPAQETQQNNTGTAQETQQTQQKIPYLEISIFAVLLIVLIFLYYRRKK
jgi:hypothetical protein